MGKEKSVFWAYFTVRGRNRHGEPNRVNYTHGQCQWEQGANATRMKKHLVEAHLQQAQATTAASLVPVVPVVSTDGFAKLQDLSVDLDVHFTCHGT